MIERSQTRSLGGNCHIDMNEYASKRSLCLCVCASVSVLSFFVLPCLRVSLSAGGAHQQSKCLCTSRAAIGLWHCEA